MNVFEACSAREQRIAATIELPGLGEFEMPRLITTPMANVLRLDAGPDGPIVTRGLKGFFGSGQITLGTSDPGEIMKMWGRNVHLHIREFRIRVLLLYVRCNLDVDCGWVARIELESEGVPEVDRR